jgi:bacterioferritin (cytochrome b1)
MKISNIERGIRTRINKEYELLQECANRVVHCDRKDEFARKIHVERFKTQEGLIEGMELALEIIKERS